ncbi:MAG: hypothetical protein SW019_23865 [Actinomycetota bacterium]|nr:hypothetical protein [Actinomycetota bacterium]
MGTEAIANAVVTRAELQRWYRPIFRNVHATRDQPLTLGDRTRGAWLWSAREGIVTGLAAAAIHGSQWIEDDIDIELIHHYPRPPSGIITRHERIADDEWAEFDGIPVTTPARTAFDLGRHQPGALSRLDALMRARPYSIEDVLILTKRYKGARGVARLKQIVGLVDAGAESPWESWWRQLVIDAGFPAPTTQIPVLDESGRHVRTLDFGWNDHKVAFEYDGEQHQSDRQQYLKDRRVWPVLARLGWQVTSTVKEDDPVDVLAQLHSSMAARGWRGTIQIPDYVYRRRRRP